MIKILDGKIPIQAWLDAEDMSDFDIKFSNVITQALNASNHPLAFHHIALMPDAHLGMSVPIGSVMPCKDGLIPAAVGSDIGCGMLSVKTSLTGITDHEIRDIIGLIYKIVPVGFNWRENPISFSPDKMGSGVILKEQMANMGLQLGTLGGGNHFIEIQRDDLGRIYFMIHCGSRNFGKKVCDHYMGKANDLNELWHSEVDPKWDLGFLPIGSREAREYIDDMKAALNFAELNRHLISEEVKKAFREVVGNCTFEDAIDIHHNYAALENHYGHNVWVHRKGATSAKKGEIGIIPGSMGTASYIVEGLGNRESFCSCSHGAGRVMGRMGASRKLTLEECDRSMEGVFHRTWTKNKSGIYDFGEAPQAYKNIEDVMKNQEDLVKPLVKLYPLGVVKG